MAIPDGGDLALWLVIAGVVLSIMEALAPGAHFVVLGVALLVAGLVGVLASSFGVVLGPFVLAALVLGSGGASLWAYRNLDFYEGSGRGSTSDSSTLTGATGHVVDRVSRSGGRVRLDDGGFDPFYSARTMDGEIPEGAEVMVLDPGGGSVLTVERTDEIGQDEIDRALARERERQAAAEEADGAGDPADGAGGPADGAGDPAEADGAGDPEKEGGASEPGKAARGDSEPEAERE